MANGGIRGPSSRSARTPTSSERVAVQYLVIAVRAMIGVVFLIAFLSKSAGRGRFAAFVESLPAMGVVPPRLVGPAAGAVVTAEGAVCALLIAPSEGATVTGLALAAGLLSVFAAAMARTIRRGTGAACRCFGASAAPLGRRHLLRNVLLTAVAAAAGLMTLADRAPTTATGALVAAAAGLVAGALVTVLDDLAALFGPSRARQIPDSTRAHTIRRPSGISGTSGRNHASPDQRRGARGGTVFAGSDPHPGRDQAPAGARRAAGGEGRRPATLGDRTRRAGR
ncbi:MauE/DoxX family redox-associated membrane protein [Streptomyces violaceusniger]|uniref:MauE/DoxX family redox-associated membrane protein n=1 Tax=Streptomyces violaceusniger TaxID=68280 RepID=UPI003CD07336